MLSKAPLSNNINLWTVYKPNFVGFWEIFLLCKSHKESCRVLKQLFLFQLVAIWEVIYDVGDSPEFCWCLQRCLSVNIRTARTDKMIAFLRLESNISRPMAVECESGECETPIEPVEVGLLVTPLGIFSVVLGNKTKSPWGTSILLLTLWLECCQSAR